MKKIRLGFIGTGNMGQMAHLRNYLTLPNCEVVALAELRPQLAAQVAARWGIPEVYHDADELLAKAKVDAYVMIQPFWIHGGLIPAVLAKGKPLTIRKAELDGPPEKSKISLMPKGLLDKLSREEILDLVAYIVARGDRMHPIFATGHKGHGGHGKE